MKKIILIRHAESQANVQKELFRYSNIIKITENGRQQAKDLVEVLEKPDRVILSKYIRTQETAHPLIEKLEKENHNFDTHLWLDTHEFENVCGERVFATMKTHEEFMHADMEYWGKQDPMCKESEHTESFKEFIDRVNGVYLKLKKIPDGLNYIFTHGWFIKLFLLMGNEYNNFNTLEKDDDLYQKIMNRFLTFDKDFKTKNTGQYDVSELVEKYCE
jgi:broad specificity phosphatase PhoE